MQTSVQLEYLNGWAKDILVLAVATLTAKVNATELVGHPALALPFLHIIDASHSGVVNRLTTELRVGSIDHVQLDGWCDFLLALTLDSSSRYSLVDWRIRFCQTGHGAMIAWKLLLLNRIVSYKWHPVTKELLNWYRKYLLRERGGIWRKGFAVNSPQINYDELIFSF